MPSLTETLSLPLINASGIDETYEGFKVLTPFKRVLLAEEGFNAVLGHVMNNMPLPAQLLAVLKGLRNGLEYGMRVRFVHGLVIMLLFKTISKTELINIFKHTIEHGRNLGLFVCFYKFGCLALNRIWGKKHLNTFLSGLIVGGLVFRKKTQVNYQIVLYLLSRVVVGLIGLGHKKWKATQAVNPADKGDNRWAYQLLCALCWGLVMWLFDVDRSTLQPSLRSSMEFLYIQSDEPVNSLVQLIPFAPAVPRANQ